MMFLGYNGALRDITDRRNAEPGVKRWKLFLDGVMNNILGIIILSDTKSGRIRLHQPRLRTIFPRHHRLPQSGNHQSPFLSSHLIDVHDQVSAFGKPINVPEDRIVIDGDVRYISARVLPMIQSSDREYLLIMATDISAEVADHNHQQLTRELAFVLEGISTTQKMWGPAMASLPEISGFSAVGVYQRSIFDDYILFMSGGGRFAPAIPRDSIVDRIICKGEPAIFDRYRMGLFPERNSVPPWTARARLYSCQLCTKADSSPALS